MFIAGMVVGACLAILIMGLLNFNKCTECKENRLKEVTGNGKNPDYER